MKEEELCDVDENDGMIFSLNADETFYLGVALRVAVEELEDRDIILKTQEGK